MSRPKKTPKYSLHKPSGQAVVRLNGGTVYLGKYGTPASHAKYARVMGEWHVNQHEAATQASRQLRGTSAPRTDEPSSVAEMLLAYWNHAQSYYVADGEQTSELEGMRWVVGLLGELYGTTPLGKFGPLALKALQQHMINLDLCRSEINKRVGRIKRIFKWAASEQLVPVTIYQALTTVQGLKRGRTKARESKPVKPADPYSVDAVLQLVAKPVAAMIQLQRLTGMRPGEVVQMRLCDIDRTDPIWIYRPERHKTEHRGHSRAVPLGPRAQEVLEPYLDREEESFCFSPAEAEEARNAALWQKVHKWRKTPVYPSEMKSRERRKAERFAKREERKRKPRDSYDTGSYRRAITYAIKRAQREDDKVVHWHPHQLRHTAATEIRREFGVEAAQVILGHTRADVTQIYAERNQAKAIEIAAKVG